MLVGGSTDWDELCASGACSWVSDCFFVTHSVMSGSRSGRVLGEKGRGTVPVDSSTGEWEEWSESCVDCDCSVLWESGVTKCLRR